MQSTNSEYGSPYLATCHFKIQNKKKIQNIFLVFVIFQLLFFFSQHRIMITASNVRGHDKSECILGINECSV